MVTTKGIDLESAPNLKSVKSRENSFWDFYEHFTRPIHFNIDLGYVLSVTQKYKSDCVIPVRDPRRQKTHNERLPQVLTPLWI